MTSDRQEIKIVSILIPNPFQNPRYILHSISLAHVTYIRSDLRPYVDDYAPASVRLDNRQETLWRLWLDGWFCNPMARYWGKLETTALVDVKRLADPSVEMMTRTEILCDYLNLHRIVIARKGFDCWRSSMASHSRGWGGEGRERWMATAGGCQRHCRQTPGCNFWTFDPTGTYGSTICWIWTGYKKDSDGNVMYGKSGKPLLNRPDEVKEEAGWISGEPQRDRDRYWHPPWQLPQVTDAMMRSFALQDMEEVGGTSLVCTCAFAVCLRVRKIVFSNIPFTNTQV